MNWLNYLAEANIYLGVFYLCYCLLLARETHYNLSRAYLLFACVISFVLPVTQLSILKPAEMLDINQSAAYVATTANVHLAPPPAPEAPPFISWQDGLIYLYIAGGLVALCVFAFRLFQLYKLSRLDKLMPGNDYQIVLLQNNNTAFSFFNYLFIGKDIARSDTIVAHELVHIRQKHSWDIMLLEILKVLNWFNPFIYLTQRSLKTIHEYIADEQTAAHEQDALTYSSFLLDNAYGLQGSTIAHSFFNYNLLKKRIIMLNKIRSGKLARLKYLAVLPLCSGMLCASTLAFAKDYGWVDLTPSARKATAEKTSDQRPATVTQSRPLPPPPPPPVDPAYAELIDYAAKHIRYPAKALNGLVDGYILVSLKLNALHKITDIKIEKGIGSGCDEEVIRALKTYKGTIKSKPGNYNFVANFILIGKDGAAIHHNKPVNNLQKYSMIGQVDINGYDSSKQLPPPPPPPAPPKPVKTAALSDDQKSAQAFNMDIAQAIRYPKSSRENNIAGRVIASFKVNDGKISNVEIVRGLDNNANAEIKRVLENYAGSAKLTSAWYSLPVLFTLVNEKGDVVKKALSPNQSQQLPPLPTPTNNNFEKNYMLNEIVITGYAKGVKPSTVSPATSGKIANPQGRQSFIIPPAPAGTDKNAKIQMPPAAYDKAYVNLYNHLTKTIRYPDDAIKTNTAGNVILSYKVDANHKITDIKLVSGVGKGCDESAIKALKSYRGNIDKTSGNYVIAATFVLKGFTKNFEPIGDIRFKPNFAGVVVVGANAI